MYKYVIKDLFLFLYCIFDLLHQPKMHHCIFKVKRLHKIWIGCLRKFFNEIWNIYETKYRTLPFYCPIILIFCFINPNIFIALNYDNFKEVVEPPASIRSACKLNESYRRYARCLKITEKVSFGSSSEANTFTFRKIENSMRHFGWFSNPVVRS